ncbi:MAG: fibronectin type III domain-containing protein [bacterium]
MKNKIYIIALILGMFLGIQGVAQGATIDSTFHLDINCHDKCPDDGFTIYGFKGNVTEIVHKTVNFVTDSQVNTPQSFNLNMDDSVSLVSGTTTGDWFIAGAQYDSPKSDGVLHDLFRRSAVNYIQMGTSIPLDDNSFNIVSENPNVVDCEDGVCKAVGEGVTHVTISFPTSKQTESYPSKCLTKRASGGWHTKTVYADCTKSVEVNGPEDGYGKIIFKAVTVSKEHGERDAMPILMTYSFPSITYTITVPSVSNVSQITSCNGVNNITTSGATVNWTYSDSDNDPQTNYAIDIATDPAFNDIIDTETAPDNTDVSGIRSLAISGLDPNTTYYARIQTYNDTNGWSDYTSCGVSFTTLDGPVDGVCGTDLNTCDDGTAESTGLNRWVCHGKFTGKDSDVCTFFKPAFSCEASQRRAVVGEDVTYTVDPDDGVSYQWFDNSNHIAGETSSSYTYAYLRTGSYNESVKMQKTDGTTETASCSTVTVDCDDSLKPDDSDCNIDGSKTNYICQPDGTWLASGTTSSCDPDMKLVDDGTSSGTGSSGGFRFTPSMVPVGGFCKLLVNVKNARVCKLVNQSNQDIPLTNTGSLPFFKVEGANRPVGTYKLYCKATTTPSHPFVQLGPSRTCYSSPNVNEH